ncbi:hypothetical protein PLESTM_001850100 [Pleodorina starrii]|nr:hypothetical protein PLESTM_001850100 [Pleodorina starrii]
MLHGWMDGCVITACGRQYGKPTIQHPYGCAPTRESACACARPANALKLSSLPPIQHQYSRGLWRCPPGGTDGSAQHSGDSGPRGEQLHPHSRPQRGTLFITFLPLFESREAYDRPTARALRPALPSKMIPSLPFPPHTPHLTPHIHTDTRMAPPVPVPLSTHTKTQREGHIERESGRQREQRSSQRHAVGVSTSVASNCNCNRNCDQPRWCGPHPHPPTPRVAAQHPRGPSPARPPPGWPPPRQGKASQGKGHTLRNCHAALLCVKGHTATRGHNLLTRDHGASHQGKYTHREGRGEIRVRGLITNGPPPVAVDRAVRHRPSPPAPPPPPQFAAASGTHHSTPPGCGFDGRSGSRCLRLRLTIRISRQTARPPGRHALPCMHHGPPEWGSMAAQTHRSAGQAGTGTRLPPPPFPHHS